MRKFDKNIVSTVLSLSLSILIASATFAAKIEDFIPDDSMVYLAFRDMDEVWETAEESENWKAALEVPEIKAWIDEVNQGLNILNLVLGNDLQGIIEMLGHQIVLTMFPGETEPMVGIIVNTAGAIREVERIVTGVIQMIGASEGNALEQNAGKYRKVEFSTVALDELSLAYGFVKDFLVIGITTGSFEGLIDTYKKQRVSIAKNKQFRRLSKKFADGQVFAYVNVDLALPLITTNMEAEQQGGFQTLGLDSLQTFAYSLDLLNVDSGHQMYAEIKPDQHRGILGSLLQEAQPSQSIQALSGDEDVFIAIAPSSSDAIWQFIAAIAARADDSGGFHNSITLVETMLNLNIKTDVLGALTGEVAVWGQFPETLGVDSQSLTDLLYATDAAIVAGLKNPSKWRTFLGNMQNLANMPIQQYDYKGTTCYQISLPLEVPTVTVHYGYVRELFLVSFSNERFELVVDGASKGRAVSGFEQNLKGLPGEPVMLLQLKLDKLLPIVIASGEREVKPSADVTERLGEIGPLVASISVKKNEAWLKIGTISAEPAIETYGRLVSLIAPAIIR